jgi:hypothetical protein
MDHKITAALPLAFVLAMAADVSATGVGRVPADEDFWRVGSLSRLLGDSDGGQPNVTAEGRSTATPDQMAQWLNFRNCFTGNWRNC